MKTLKTWTEAAYNGRSPRALIELDGSDLRFLNIDVDRDGNLTEDPVKALKRMFDYERKAMLTALHDRAPAEIVRDALKKFEEWFAKAERVASESVSGEGR